MNKAAQLRHAPKRVTLGWDALGIASRSPRCQPPGRCAAACRASPTCSSRPTTVGRSPTPRSSFFSRRRRRFPRSRSASRRRAPYCFPMLQIGGDVTEGVANGRRRRAVAPQAIQQRACLPPNMLLLLCAECKSLFLPMGAPLVRCLMGASCECVCVRRFASKQFARGLARR